jgi:hypothetical protein
MLRRSWCNLQVELGISQIDCVNCSRTVSASGRELVPAIVCEHKSQVSSVCAQIRQGKTRTQEFGHLSDYTYAKQRVTMCACNWIQTGSDPIRPIELEQKNESGIGSDGLSQKWKEWAIDWAKTK